MKMLSLFPTLLLASGSLMAAERIEHTVTVTAQIPTENFYVVPVGDWHITPQRLTWDPYRKVLNGFNKPMDIKSTLGPVKAFLAYPPKLSSDGYKNNIDLQVKVAGVALTVVPTQILNQADASIGKLVAMEVTPVKEKNVEYEPGNYQGVVNVMFESEAPAA